MKKKPVDETRSAIAKMLGRAGGLEYAANHTKAERSANASRAAKARWSKSRPSADTKGAK